MGLYHFPRSLQEGAGQCWRCQRPSQELCPLRRPGARLFRECHPRRHATKHRERNRRSTIGRRTRFLTIIVKGYEGVGAFNSDRAHIWVALQVRREDWNQLVRRLVYFTFRFPASERMDYDSVLILIIPAPSTQMAMLDSTLAVHMEDALSNVALYPFGSLWGTESRCYPTLANIDTHNLGPLSRLRRAGYTGIVAYASCKALRAAPQSAMPLSGVDGYGQGWTMGSLTGYKARSRARFYHEAS
jgi:hypothetical protein